MAGGWLREGGGRQRGGESTNRVIKRVLIGRATRKLNDLTPRQEGCCRPRFVLVVYFGWKYLYWFAHHSRVGCWRSERVYTFPSLEIIHREKKEEMSHESSPTKWLDKMNRRRSGRETEKMVEIPLICRTWIWKCSSEIGDCLIILESTQWYNNIMLQYIAKYTATFSLEPPQIGTTISSNKLNFSINFSLLWKLFLFFF